MLVYRLIMLRFSGTCLFFGQSLSSGQYRGPAKVNSDKRQNVNEIATRDKLPRPNCNSDGKAENERQKTVVWLIYHQSEYREEVNFVNFPSLQGTYLISDL